MLRKEKIFFLLLDKKPRTAFTKKSRNKHTKTIKPKAKSIDITSLKWYNLWYVVMNI